MWNLLEYKGATAEKETRLRNERKSRGAGKKPGVNHLSIDDKAAKAVISVDAGSTSGPSRYAGASFQDYVGYKQWEDDWMVSASLMFVCESILSVWK